MRFRTKGVFPAMLTPFTKKGDVDYDKAGELALYLAKKKVHGLFVAGTTGEGLLMTPEERKQLLEVVVAAVGKRVDVIAHTGCLDFATTVDLTRHAREAGAKAAGVVTPGFYGYDDASLYRYYKTVAAAVKGFPVLLYNLPSCAKNVLSANLIVRLATDIDNIAGLKDSSGDLSALSDVVNNAPKGFVVINGVDDHSYLSKMAGVDGFVASGLNVVPELFLSIYNNVNKGKLKAAQKAQAKLNKAAALLQYGRMVAFYKEGMRLRGFDPGYVRIPQRELTGAERKAFQKGMEDAELI
jgi:dihydrodipicolinate synthase/N-acetylneuraminate lyase